MSITPSDGLIYDSACSLLSSTHILFHQRPGEREQRASVHLPVDRLQDWKKIDVKICKMGASETRPVEDSHDTRSISGTSTGVQPGFHMSDKCGYFLRNAGGKTPANARLLGVGNATR